MLLGGLAGHWSVGGEQWVRLVNPNDIGVLVLSIFSLLS